MLTGYQRGRHAIGLSFDIFYTSLGFPNNCDISTSNDLYRLDNYCIVRQWFNSVLIIILICLVPCSLILGPSIRIQYIFHIATSYFKMFLGILISFIARVFPRPLNPRITRKRIQRLRLMSYILFCSWFRDKYNVLLIKSCIQVFDNLQMYVQSTVQQNSGCCFLCGVCSQWLSWGWEERWHLSHPTEFSGRQI